MKEDSEADAFDRVLVPVTTKNPSDRVSHTFVYDDFDDMDEYGEVLQRYYGKQQAHLHELAHGRTALAVGASSIRYSVEYRQYYDWGERSGERSPLRAVTRILSDEKVPMIARLAINAAPIDPSPSDLEPILRFYGSLQNFEKRVHYWNDTNGALYIPPPGTLDDRRTV